VKSEEKEDERKEQILLTSQVDEMKENTEILISVTKID
jgi:hypothetical protein